MNSSDFGAFATESKLESVDNAENEGKIEKHHQQVHEKKKAGTINDS